MGYKTDKISQRLCVENKHCYIKCHVTLKGFVSHGIKISYYTNKKIILPGGKMLDNTVYKKLFLTI